MFLKPQFRKAGGWLLLMAVTPSPLLAQTDFDPNSIFQAPAGHISGAPSLPPSASDPFTPPPVGSIPLGSAESPLTSPATSSAELPDDPFGTPAPENRQVRQVGAALAPAEETAAPAAGAPAPAAPAADQTPAFTDSEARQTMDEAQRARLRALFPDMLPPEDQTISVLSAQAVPAAPEQPEEDGAAISRAGALLTQEYYGQAKILPPLELPPAQKEAAPAPEAKTEDTAPVKPQPTAKTEDKAPAKPQPTAKPQAAPPPKAAKAAGGQTRTPAPPLPRGSLALVNDTGDPQVGAIYQSALSRLGYTILAGPAGGFNSGPAGQTIIYYRPGAKGRAQAVSRDIPGRKTMAEAPPGATADVVVVLR
jgi:hypothetical protein